MATVEDLRRLEDELRAAESRRHVLEGEVRDLKGTRERIAQELARVEIQMSQREDLIYKNRPLEEGVRRRIEDIRRELERQRLEYHGPEGYDARAKVGLYPAPTPKLYPARRRR